MLGKILVGILVTLSLLLSSCYPELSVQQYDRLKEDLIALDVERQELQAELAVIKAEIATIKAENEAKNAETLAYVEFLDKLVSTQSSEMILAGQFDVVALTDANAELAGIAERLGDNEIIYYLGLMDRDNESQTVAAYYKVIEYCLKKMKQNLE